MPVVPTMLELSFNSGQTKQIGVSEINVEKGSICTHSWDQSYKTFYNCYLQMFVISKSVCSWQGSPA
jgi:hypothetical protein